MSKDKNIMKLCFHLGHVRQKLIDLQDNLNSFHSDDPYSENIIFKISKAVEEIESEINIDDILEILTEGDENE